MFVHMYGGVTLFKNGFLIFTSFFCPKLFMQFFWFCFPISASYISSILVFQVILKFQSFFFHLKLGVYIFNYKFFISKIQFYTLIKVTEHWFYFFVSWEILSAPNPVFVLFLLKNVSSQCRLIILVNWFFFPASKVAFVNMLSSQVRISHCRQISQQCK